MKLSKLTIYDYADKPVTIEFPEKEVHAILVSVLSGDETGAIIFDDESVKTFDASYCRIKNYYDGRYYVLGDSIEKWVNFTPIKEENYPISYQRRDKFHTIMIEDLKIREVN